MQARFSSTIPSIDGILQSTHHTLPVIGADYGRLPAAAASEYRYGVSNTGARLPNAYQQLPFDPQSQEEMTPEMAILLDSLRKTGVPLGSNSQIGGLLEYEHALRARGKSLNLGPVGMDLSYPYVQVPTSASLPGLGQVQAHNGFTPAEEMILQAHANTRAGMGRGNTIGQASQHTLVRGQRHAATAGANLNTIGMGIRGRRNVAPPLAFNSPPVSQGYVSGMSSIDVLPVGSTGGDDFQSNLTLYHHGSQFDGEVVGRNSAGRSHDLRVDHHNTADHVTRSSHDFDTIAIQQQL